MLNDIANAMCHEIGIPRQLQQHLEAVGSLPRPDFHRQSCYSPDQIQWQNWPSSVDRPLLWKKDPLGGFLAHTPDLPDLNSWVVADQIQGWHCDIRDIQALAASKSPLEFFSDLDTFALNRAGWCIQDVSVAGLQDNLDWHEVRITEPGGCDYFQINLWEGPRVSLCNAGGSHHFAAARWIAGKLQHSTPLTGRLVVQALNDTAIQQVCRDYRMVAIPWRDHRVWQAIQGVQAPVVRMRMPSPAHDYSLLLFPVTDRRSRRAAELLRKHGALDVNQWLEGQLACQAKAIQSLADAGLLSSSPWAA